MKVIRNPAIAAMSGRNGDTGWIYRTRADGVTIAYSLTPNEKPPSLEQERCRDRFKAAQSYARKVMADPLRRELYQRLARDRKKPTNTLLVSNFLNPPEIEQVVLADYAGRPGQLIRVLANDAIEVVSVEITIRTAAGSVIESGRAVSDHGVWTYTTTAAVGEGSGWQIEIKAANRAGREAVAYL